MEESTQWPSDYLYKFIVPSEPEKTEEIRSIFSDTDAAIEARQSRNGKYTSLSIRVTLENPDKVIEKYRLVGEVKGVISL